MHKRSLAILALVLFLAGVVVFFASIATGHNEYAFYVAILLAPGALMAFLQRRLDRHAQDAAHDQQRDTQQ